MEYRFIDSCGSFQLDKPENNSYLYLPLANTSGVMACITPDGHGDSKLSQDEFLLEPVSSENLHESAGARNFWCKVKGYGAWSVMGCSAKQEAARFEESQDLCEMKAGQLWQEVTRVWKETGLKAKVKNYCPVSASKAEIMIVALENSGQETLEITPTAAIPLFARGADHIRDHRHVTSLLNCTKVTEDGVTVTPTMAFDERGHHYNFHSYSVFARGEDGTGILGAFPLVEEFTGEGGSLLWPEAVVCDTVKMEKPGYRKDGYESIGALRFPMLTLKPGESFRYVILLSYDKEGMEYLDIEKADQAFDEMCTYWQNQKTVSICTGDERFNGWMEWVGLQPFLRRIYGCSFLPHHDYGRGGRGWRDLWQDCLALILMNPAQVRDDLMGFFAGVRADGSNATIIGSRPGEFKADRNNIVRIWMDHGYWPFFTVSLYLKETGDYDFLMEENTYFKDQTVQRGEKTDMEYDPAQGTALLAGDGAIYKGTVLEHLIVQQLTQFYDVGEHNHMRLRGADWNDALDMARERGESVAFTAAYSGNLKELAQVLQVLEKNGTASVELAKELEILLFANEEVYDTVSKKQETLKKYCAACAHTVSGEKISVSTGKLAEIILGMAGWIQNHIRRTELVEDGKGNSWFNGYYDNNGRKAEGIHEGHVRMMLTSQVFTILSGTANDEQIEKISRSADQYLYEKNMGGYRLNTDFHEVKLDLGRMFGFAYGHKENGAVFCHMAVMYSYALYERGFAREGRKVIDSLFSQCMDFETSRIYPGIPEYFNEKGRGMYSYLTGAASWLVLTVLTQMYGVKGKEGNLHLNPQLMRDQFDEKSEAKICCSFAGRKTEVTYCNYNNKEIGDYEAAELWLNGELYHNPTEKAIIARNDLVSLPENETVKIKVILE